jgi:predicted DNA-binding transcriptional regulator YafY
MSKSKLTGAQKDMIVLNFTHKRMTIAKMAETLEVSIRTIGRVLTERGLAGPITQVRENAAKFMKIMKDHGITTDAHLAVVLDEHRKGPSEFRVLKAISEMDEASYNTLLAKIIHLREAKKHNISVTGAMMKLERKAEDNANDTKAG